LKKLQEHGYTVVVYSQDEQKANTTRSLSGIFSPGTYFSLDSNNITNNTTCIWINVVEVSCLTSKYFKKGNTNMTTSVKGGNKFVQVGLANIDIYTGRTSIFEFKEIYIKNPTTFDEMERFLSIYQPNEIILIGNVCEDELDDILSYANVRVSSIHKISLIQKPEAQLSETMKRAFNSEKQIYQKELLERFYSVDDFDTFSQIFYENTIATQSFCFLLDFIYQHNPNLVHKISEPIFENCSDRLILANHSLKQLNIIEDSHNMTGKFSSVEKMLNACITPMGKRRF
jgi:DNA mismatch repair protein MutS